MTTTTRWTKAALFGAALGLSALSGHALAHHSFAMFDRDRVVTLQGVIKEFQWTNPHSWSRSTSPMSRAR